MIIRDTIISSKKGGICCPLSCNVILCYLLELFYSYQRAVLNSFGQENSTNINKTVYMCVGEDPHD